jgi:hypothetical protein
MMKTMIQDGRYQAKIVNYEIALTKAGDPQVIVNFEFEYEGNPTRLRWYGSLKETQRERTIDTLILCGLKSNDLKVLATGVQDGITPALDLTREFQIVVENQDNNGKTFTKIRYVNASGASKFKNVIPAEALTKIGALNLEGAIMARRQQKTQTSSAAPTASVATATAVDMDFADDLAF